MKKGNLIFSVLCIVAGAILIGIASGYPTAEQYGTGVPGPGLWPIVISGVMVACAVLLLIKTLRAKPEDMPEIKLLTPNHIRVYIVMAIMVVYCLVLPIVGFIISTAVMQFIMLQWFRKKNPLVNLGIALVITLVVYFAFLKLLNVPVDFGLFAL